MRGLARTLIAIGAAAVTAAAHPAHGQGAVAPYRARILGVFDAQSGEPVEGAEVSDALSKTFAVTTKTGTVSLSFLPEGGSLVRIRKIGYSAATLMVAISPADTVPLTVLLSTAAQVLPTVVTKDNAPKHLSPGLREFDERQRTGLGHYVVDSVLRKQENRTTMTNIVRQFPSITIVCPTRGLRMGQCWAQSARRGCPPTVYVDGVRWTDNDLEKLRINEFSGVEWYPGPSTVPAMYNMTGSSCGVLLFWTRDR